MLSFTSKKLLQVVSHSPVINELCGDQTGVNPIWHLWLMPKVLLRTFLQYRALVRDSAKKFGLKMVKWDHTFCTPLQVLVISSVQEAETKNQGE